MLQGKRAIVTGSNSGIGLGVAAELAKAGAEVILNSFTDRPEDHALAAQLTEERAQWLAATGRVGAESAEEPGEVLAGQAGSQPIEAVKLAAKMD